MGHENVWTDDKDDWNIGNVEVVWLVTNFTHVAPQGQIFSDSGMCYVEYTSFDYFLSRSVEAR